MGDYLPTQDNTIKFGRDLNLRTLYSSD